MRYANDELERQDIETAYRIYVTDALQQICENTARASGGAYSNARFYDIINPKPGNEDLRSGEEIAADIIRGLEEITMAGGETENEYI